ncbi:MAG: dihydropteroate synthase [Candidatus Lokiarchaeota archaeon]|nr:dihydropteroate synthase [Candidatus Lokiarchaeota archaeon]
MVIIHRDIFPDFFIGDQTPPLFQGILNLSPESFYKGSVIQPDIFNGVVKDFLKKGVKILDVGSRSTAPGVISITREEELERLKPYISTLCESLPKDIIISVDTQYSDIAKYCITQLQQENLRVIINDVSGLKIDPHMIDTIIDHDIPLILMASHKRPGDLLSVDSILESLFESIQTLEQKNYDMNKLIIDPGIGKWVPEKTFEYDLSIIDDLERFRVFLQPILVGISRKSFIGSVLDKKDPEDRLIGTLAATTIAVYNGAHIIRTHDVTDELQEMVTMAYAIRKNPLVSELDGITAEFISCIREPIEARYYLRRMGVTPAGARIMDTKMITKLILLENITAPQALVLKQELLARGGDVAIHKNVVTTENQKYEKNQKVILIGTEKQLQLLVNKLKGQQLELDKIATLISDVLMKSREVKSLHTINP